MIGALRGTTHVLAVTEPTPLGAHDLDLILSLLDMFEVSKSVVVNRADLPGRLDQIRKVAARSMTVRSRPVWDWTNSCWQAICKGLPVVKSHPDSLAAVTFMDVADNLTEKYLGKEKEAA